jgi:hypothetical protein
VSKRLAGIAGLVLFVTLAGAAGGAERQGRDWILLGQRQVSDQADHDVIEVTAARGEFRRIKFTVQRASVDFHRVTVHFGNGGSQGIQMRNTIPAGGESRAIDLEGDDRVINRVEFWYDANTFRGRVGMVRLLGMR